MLGRCSADEVNKIGTLLENKISNVNAREELSEQLLKGAVDGGEMESTKFDDWFSSRLKPQMVWLEKDDYLKALVNALWLAPIFAGTDFGSSRQRDLAQVWTDTARGFLGEAAFCKFLEGRYGISVRTDTRRGRLEEFLPSDISEVKARNSDWRKCRLRVSVKTTKFNGRWMDLPGAQLDHSDAFVLIKLGILRHHFVSFLKAVSFIKDKLIPSAKELNVLDNGDAARLWDEIPSFEPIPAYVAGFLIKRDLKLPIHSVTPRLKGRGEKRRIVITKGVGLFDREALRQCPEIKKLAESKSYPIVIEPIGELTEKHFYANSGALKYGDDWKRLVSAL